MTLNSQVIYNGVIQPVNAPNLRYSWFAPNGNSPISTSLNAIVSTGGVYTFEAKDTTTGCLNSANNTVNLFQREIISISSNNLACIGDQNTYTASTPNNTIGNYILNFYVNGANLLVHNGSNVSINSNQLSIVFDSAFVSQYAVNNQIILSVSGDHQNGCESATPNQSTITTISSPTNISITSTRSRAFNIQPAYGDTICLNNGVGQATNNLQLKPSSGTLSSGYNYQWFKDNSPIPSATNQTYLPNLSGDYKLKATNGLGCSTTSNTITLLQRNNPQIQILGPNQVCLNDDKSLTATISNSNGSTNYQYQWNINQSGQPTGNTSAQDVITDLSTSYAFASPDSNLYRVTVLDENTGCYSSKDRWVKLKDYPSTSIISSNGNTICPNGSMTLASSGPSMSNYTWKYISSGMTQPLQYTITQPPGICRLI